MNRNVPQDSRIMAVQFRGDQNAVDKRSWAAFPVTAPGRLDPECNVFFAVSAMNRDATGKYRRRKGNFSGGLLLMIDDLGSGAGSKFPLSIIDTLTPSALIETSKNNFQAIFFFEHLETDIHKFTSLIKGFIAKQFLGNDPGMAGVNRVFRPPIGVNAKEKYMIDGEPWSVRLAMWNEGIRYSIEEIADRFDISLSPPRPRIPSGATVNRAQNIRAFIDVRAALREAGMVKEGTERENGWVDIYCPWTNEHTGSIDNGAGICEPAEENGYYGGFKCHHGACMDRGWGELTQYLSTEQAAILAMINNNAKDFSDYEK